MLHSLLLVVVLMQWPYRSGFHTISIYLLGQYDCPLCFPTFPNYIAVLPDTNSFSFYLMTKVTDCALAAPLKPHFAISSLYHKQTIWKKYQYFININVHHWGSFLYASYPMLYLIRSPNLWTFSSEVGIFDNDWFSLKDTRLCSESG